MGMGDMMDYFKKLAYGNDERLMSAATYHESKGMMRPIDPIKVCERFSEFKMRVNKGSLTIEEIEKRVYSEFGIMSDPILKDKGTVMDLPNKLNAEKIVEMLKETLPPDIVKKIEQLDEELAEHLRKQDEEESNK